ncbi:MAG: CidA/LrgA family protein [Paracoccus sp. (in: a-proteobacteria)]|uniref:CidA/LrgA family protein n=1 Tax=Paracoccus sp. TaxID=267 RepID=UPI0026DEECA3|nr:CidA/LrgA family protein [Paracoccus sp. (in: a-proteobacteria)]MDO5622877.1 CidA/LrgA family protein [Paracoccus sp. (in: a-proteobacteria)]
MVPGLVIILAFQLAGEVTTRALHLPVPGPVLGLLYLVALCAIWPRLVELLRPVAQLLLGNLSLFFVPAGVGVVAQLGVLEQHAIGFAVAIVVSTAMAIVVGGLVFQFVARRIGATDEDEE